MNKNIPQLATVRINCKGSVGTGVILFPGENVDDVYVLTAKHCLAGKYFDRPFEKWDITLDQIFNGEDKTYQSYTLTETDVIVTSDDQEDLSVLILPKNRILPLTGKEFFYPIIDTNPDIKDYELRGFAQFNNQQLDRPFPLKYNEDQKDNPVLFTLKSQEQLDTYYQQALENVEGLSGGGTFAIINGHFYLSGIIHSYEDANLFIATKAKTANSLLAGTRFSEIPLVKPETNRTVLTSFEAMEKNMRASDNRIRGTIGSLAISRETGVLSRLIQQSRLTVVHGKPGVGKSALAKAAISAMCMGGNTSIITFTPEELYCESLHQALNKAGYTATIDQIIGSPLSGRNVVIWIESFEKLIESGYEGAFNEILRMLKQYHQLSLVITIREYLLQKLKITYRYELPENAAYYPVSEFSDAEMLIVRREIPGLGLLLDNPKINHLLRTPYYLDKVTRIIPELLREDELDEAQFQKLMWKYIVEANDVQRGQVFYEVCLKRAREMTLYTAFDQSEAITALVRDSLLQVEQDGLGDRFGPSHDILEDWALLRFIKKQYREAASAKLFLTDLEDGPAIRRAFRLWLDEYYRLDPSASGGFVHGLLLDPELPQHWRDELLIASLRSDNAKIMLEAFKEQLLSGKGFLLKNLIRLLETSCKTIDPKSKSFDDLLPVGSGWDGVICFVKCNLNEIVGFGETEIELQCLQVIESWSKQLPEFDVQILPPAAADAAYLLDYFIRRFQMDDGGHRHGRRDSSLLKRYVTILFKLTSAAPEIIGDMVDAAFKGKPNEKWTNAKTLNGIRAYMTCGVISDQLCKYFPDLIIRAATEDWTKKETPHHPGSIMSMIHQRPQIEDFGLDGDINGRHDFPSGYLTFFYSMFLYHPGKALDFLMPFLNAAFERNKQILVTLGSRDEDVTIKFTDETTRTYFGNHGYWIMYRGISARNRIITSLLMGLEAGLLDLADKGNTNYATVKVYLSKLIKDSNNVAVLGVVSSVIQAHPDLLDETSVSILGVPQLFRWDSSRYSSEFIVNIFNDDDFGKAERLRSNKRFHRKKYYLGLVGFVAEYMFYYRDVREMLFKQVDAMWAAAPKEDKLWKKFLFDMDARKYTVEPIKRPGKENFVQFVPGYDAEVKQDVMADSLIDPLPPVNSVWADKAFKGEQMTDHNYQTWQRGYQYLIDHGSNHFMTSPCTMATLGLRDFFDELDATEIDWCVQILLQNAERHLVKQDRFDMRFNVLDEKPALYGLSYLFKANSDNTLKQKSREVIFRLLLSGLDERDRRYLESGIATVLSQYEPEFVTNCWYGLLAYIAKESDGNKHQAGNNLSGDDDDFEMPGGHSDLTSDADWEDQLVSQVATGTLDYFEPNPISLDIPNRWLLDSALRIIPSSTTLAAQHLFINQVLKAHLEFLGDPGRNSYNIFSSQKTFQFFYPRYLLNQPRERASELFIELLDHRLPAVDIGNKDEVNDFIYDLIKEFILAVNQGSSVENFWVLWECLRIWIIEHLNAALMPLFLMDLEWSEATESWHVLNGKNLYYKSFIEEWGFNRINASIKFLTGVAFGNFMPDSVSWVATMLKSQNGYSVNTKLAEKFAEMAFYRYGNVIKNRKPLLNDFIFILDVLIIKGSSKAYMLKDEMIQYK